MSPLRAHLSWNRFRWDIFTMSNCWLTLGVPKGSRTVNWVGESPDYIPCKHETNRDTSDDRTNVSVAITGAGCRIDEGFEGRGAVERTRNRGDNCGGERLSAWPHRDIFPFIGHKSNNAIPYDTRADAEVRQNDTNA
ncbi:hypothetical protein ALC62_08043 [Cyphomyrmex costatus]|uniref:Uncharacterized protein n=1 Tax=Cyphomyrmex costatus TaxID=456900 RepID=A0A195CKE5_9HYME|nr:hypothetical protein ALC62_08043 [Cyphomyrmex costatus]